MKKMKFAALALALVSMVGLSSCLNGSGDNVNTVSGFMKVNKTYGTIYFTAPDSDIKFVPATTLNLTSNSALAYVYGEYNSDEVSATTKQISLSNVQCQPLQEISVGDEQSERLVSCELTDATAGTVWGSANKYFIVAMYYYVQLSSTGQVEEAELNKHRFYAYADPSEDLKDGILTVHLRHTIDGLSLGDKKIEDVYTQRAGAYLYFDLSLFASMTGDDGKAVSKIKIAYQKTSTVTLNPTVDETLSNEFALATKQ